MRVFPRTFRGFCDGLAAELHPAEPDKKTDQAVYRGHCRDREKHSRKHRARLLNLGLACIDRLGEVHLFLLVLRLRQQ